MKTYIKVATVLSLGIFLYSCSEDLPWDGEVYKKEISVLSSSSNILNLEYSLEEPTEGNVLSFVCSGSKNHTTDVNITIGDDDILFDKYNKTNFDVDKAKFAKIFKTSKYILPAISVTLKKGEERASIPIVVENAVESFKDISPDSIYFIPLAIKEVSAYEISPTKFNVLVRMHFRNKFAAMKTTTSYLMTGTAKVGVKENTFSLTKRFSPVSKNVVRFFPYDIVNSAKLDEIRMKSLVIEVDPANNKAVVKPYYVGDEAMAPEVEMLESPTDPTDPMSLYANKYDEPNTRFLMHYRYRIYDTTKNQYGDWTPVREILDLVKAPS